MPSIGHKQFESRWQWSQDRKPKDPNRNVGSDQGVHVWWPGTASYPQVASLWQNLLCLAGEDGRWRLRPRDAASHLVLAVPSTAGRATHQSHPLAGTACDKARSKPQWALACKPNSKRGGLVSRPSSTQFHQELRGRDSRLDNAPAGVSAASDAICRFALPCACSRVKHEQEPQSSDEFTSLRGNSMLAGITSPLVKTFVVSRPFAWSVGRYTHYCTNRPYTLRIPLSYGNGTHPRPETFPAS